LAHWATNANGINYNSCVGIGGNPLNSGYKLTVTGASYFEGVLNMSDNPIVYVTSISENELGSMSTPSSGYAVWWAGTDNFPHYTSDAGVSYDLTKAYTVNSGAPATSTSTGTTGEIRYDATYIYICTGTNTWKRTALTTW
jgi:hypothetical protein